jgi:prepilin peptidase CpaA
VTLDPAHVVVFAALAAIAATYDVWRRRIPNWISVAIAASGVVAQWTALGVRGAGSAILAVLLVLVLMTLMWRVRLVGGGDAKVASAAAAWVGTGATLSYLVVSALVGGGFALGYYIAAAANARAAVRFNLSRLHVPTVPDGTESATAILVPYGAACVVGALLVVLS